MAAALAPAMNGRVPHYGGPAALTGSLIFLVLVAVYIGTVLFKRRR